MVYSYTRILVNKRNEALIHTATLMDLKNSSGKCKTPITKRQTSYNSICMNCPKQTNSKKQKVEQQLPRRGSLEWASCAVTAPECRVSSDGTENVLKLTVITAAQTDEHNYSLHVHFKWQKCMIWELQLNKAVKKRSY